MQGPGTAGLTAYVPLLVMFVLAGGSRSSRSPPRPTWAPALQPRQARHLRVRHRAVAAAASVAAAFPVAYYLTAMMFILFDVEMVFLYPFVINIDALGLFGLVEVVLFIGTVAFAYAYVWRRGGLDWTDRGRLRSPTDREVR